MDDASNVDEAVKQVRRQQLWLIAIMLTLLFTLFVQWQLKLEHQEIRRENTADLKVIVESIRAEIAALQVELGRYIEIQNSNQAYVVTLHIKMAEAGIEVPEVPPE